MHPLVILMLLAFAVGAVAQETVPEASRFGGAGTTPPVAPLVEWSRVGFGLMELALTIVLGFLVVFVAHRALMWSLGFQNRDLKRDTLSAGVLSAATLIGMSLVVRSLLYPISNLLHTQINLPDGQNTLLVTLAFVFAFGVIAFGVALGTLFLALRVFDFLTKGIEEIQEIQNGNLTVALILAGVIVSLSLFLAEGLNSLLVSLIPGLQVRLL